MKGDAAGRLADAGSSAPSTPEHAVAPWGPRHAPRVPLTATGPREGVPPGARGARRIGILGGTFDPIHRGHLALAAAAERRCRLDWIYFVPAAHPGHKAAPVARFADRYAMTALALTARRRWSPLAIPAPPDQPTHSIQQVGWVARQHPRARLFFILGADAMVELPTWHRYRELLGACDFVVAPRLGLGLQALAAALPPGMVLRTREGEVLAGRRQLWWLENFRELAGSRQLRASLGRNRQRYPAALPVAVAAYLRRGGFYRR